MREILNSYLSNKFSTQSRLCYCECIIYDSDPYSTLYRVDAPFLEDNNHYQFNNFNQFSIRYHSQSSIEDYLKMRQRL